MRVHPQSEKLRHLAACLPLIGLFLLMPPILLVFGIQTTAAGVPLIVLYIFGVWGGLIAGAAVLARYLDDGGKGAGGPTSDESTPGAQDPAHTGSDPDPPG